MTNYLFKLKKFFNKILLIIAFNSLLLNLISHVYADSQSASPKVLSRFFAESQNKNPFLIYNETNYLPQSLNVVNEGKLTYQLLDKGPLSGYLGIALGQDLQSNSQLIYNDNHMSPLVGIRYSPQKIPFGVYLEYRKNLRMINKPDTRDFANDEIRLGGFYYQWLKIGEIRKDFHLFQETYGEAVFNSNLQSGVMMQAWAKQGIRSKISHQIDLDGYLELAGTTDGGQIDYNNYGYLDLGLRANIRISSVLTQFIFKKPVEFIAQSNSFNLPWTAQLIFAV